VHSAVDTLAYPVSWQDAYREDVGTLTPGAVPHGRKDASLARFHDVEAEDSAAATQAGPRAAQGEDEAATTVVPALAGRVAGQGTSSTANAAAAAAAASFLRPELDSTCAGQPEEQTGGAAAQLTPQTSSSGGGGRSSSRSTSLAATEAPPIAAVGLAEQLAASLGVSRPPTFEERRAGSMAARLLSTVVMPRPPCGTD
jgi:hypothetical protein